MNANRTLLFICIFLIAPVYVTNTAGYSEVDMEEFSEELDRPVPVTPVQGVLAKQALLPCDITPMNQGESVTMVLWFRDTSGEPFYSYDTRTGNKTKAVLWSSAEELGSRAHFRAPSQPAHLLIDDLQVTDDGVYRCRVDFRDSPTRNSRINLTVIEPPERPVIIDGKRGGRTNLIEPYNEGSDVLLICEVQGGQPPPNVTWYLDNTVIDESYDHRPDGLTVNKLLFANVGRQHHNSRLVCMASNSNISPPTSRVVLLEVYLKPTSVQLLTKERFVSADKSIHLECKSTGSRPEAVITWWLGLRPLSRQAKQYSETGNQLHSVLFFTPTLEDDGKYLTCRSENPFIADSNIEDRWRLVVHFAPVVTLRMGVKLNADKIKEGDDVYFECHIKANPKPYKISWFKNGLEMHQSLTSGIILSDQSLVLQSVSQNNSGDYICQADNVEGKRGSNVVTLRVQYAPVCSSDQVLVLGAVKHETLILKCDVDSSPPATSYIWTFKATGDTSQLNSVKSTNETHVPRMNYTPTSHMDYGTVSCWARNAVDVQASPCVFRIVAASRPYPLQNCTLAHHTPDSIEVNCKEGYDGGFSQSFLLEVVVLPSLRLEQNMSLMQPPVVFRLPNLKGNTSYRILLFAANQKGRSEPTVLDNLRLGEGVKFKGSEHNLEVNIPPFLLALALTAATLLFVACFVLVVIHQRTQNSKLLIPSSPEEQRIGTKLSKYLTDSEPSQLESMDSNCDIEPTLEVDSNDPEVKSKDFDEPRPMPILTPRMIPRTMVHQTTITLRGPIVKSAC